MEGGEPGRCYKQMEGAWAALKANGRGLGGAICNGCSCELCKQKKAKQQSCCRNPPAMEEKTGIEKTGLASSVLLTGMLQRCIQDDSALRTHRINLLTFSCRSMVQGGV